MTFRSGQVPSSLTTSHFPLYLWFTQTHAAQVTTPYPGLALTVNAPPLCDTASKSTKASLITDCAYVCKHVYNIKLAIIMGLYKHMHVWVKAWPLRNHPTKTGEAGNRLLNIRNIPQTGHILRENTGIEEVSIQIIVLLLKIKTSHLIYIKRCWTEYRALRYSELKTWLKLGSSALTIKLGHCMLSFGFWAMFIVSLEQWEKLAECYYGTLLLCSSRSTNRWKTLLGWTIN